MRLQAEVRECRNSRSDTAPRSETTRSTTGARLLLMTCARVLALALFLSLSLCAGCCLQYLQQEDLANLGRLMLCLACRNQNAAHNVSKSIEFVASHYSADLKARAYPSVTRVTASNLLCAECSASTAATIAEP
jgi:hypothetical protein